MDSYEIILFFYSWCIQHNFFKEFYAFLVSVNSPFRKNCNFIQYFVRFFQSVNIRSQYLALEFESSFIRKMQVKKLLQPDHQTFEKMFCSQGKKIHTIFIPFRHIFKLIYKEAFSKKKTKAQNNHHQHSTSSATAK